MRQVISKVLSESKVIAVVGWSPKPDRASHGVAQFLADRNYKVIAINPGHAGQPALGGYVRASLTEALEADGPIDMVDIFRRSEEVGPVVDEAIAIGARSVWMQLGVINAEAALRASQAGLDVVMDRCPKIEISQLGL